MTSFRVGCVPYVNAIPLAMPFVRPDSNIEVRFDVPSRLPSLLDSGEAQAILVSSFDALTQANRRMGRRVCIGSFGPVESVRLFSKVPFEKICSLALDQSSMTSNSLAQIVLAESLDCRPSTCKMAPDLNSMLEGNDACVLIGDIGMAADGTGLHVLDLGEAWTDLTGLPFVWAAWVGRDEFSAELADQLGSALEQGFGVDDWVQAAVTQSGWEEEVARRYFGSTMRYEFTHEMETGLKLFQSKLANHGFPAHFWPVWADSPVPAV